MTTVTQLNRQVSAPLKRKVALGSWSGGCERGLAWRVSIQIVWRTQSWSIFVFLWCTAFLRLTHLYNEFISCTNLIHDPSRLGFDLDTHWNTFLSLTLRLGTYLKRKPCNSECGTLNSPLAAGLMGESPVAVFCWY